ncbi:hypothetical protein CEXT_423231 [Caerostris extrusa]|uniref:Uncharacterized protein n=1 Tax=Caerostris extrusa TaxID=172846 RepID=A0AAV4RCI1_CAEEX|nr:hypothetical protein CEXT_423231 [Caerostris extrusa]
MIIITILINTSPSSRTQQKKKKKISLQHAYRIINLPTCIRFRVIAFGKTHNDQLGNGPKTETLTEKILAKQKRQKKKQKKISLSHLYHHRIS